MDAAVSAARTRYGFGDFELDLRSGELLRQGARVKLQLQPLKVLAFLVAHAGQVVTRDELRRLVWGPDTFVDYEQGLNYCIRQIRAALGDAPTASRYIETCPRLGYRFLAPVAERPAGDSADARVMLAVLPLENIGRDEQQEYFADGLTEDIITELGRRFPHQIGVIARTSAIRYKRTARRIDEIGRELGVDYVVEGSVRRDGDRVRITAQLIRVSDQTHVWARAYERRVADVLMLQSEVASAIAAEVLVTLVPRAGTGDVSVRRVQPEAYEACLKARFLWRRRTRDALYGALDCFAQSLQADPEYAPAFAGMADAYLALLDYHYIAPNQALPLAAAAARNALRLDERLADAHTSAAHANLHALDWNRAEQGFRRAIDLEPGYVPAHFYYANLLCARRRFDDALAEAREALRLDPVSMVGQINVATLCYIAGRHDEGLQACRKALELEAGLAPPHELLGRLLLESGASDEAIAALERAVRLADRDATYLASLGYGYGVSGRRDLGTDVLDELTVLSATRYVAPSDLAFVHAGLGHRDDAISWLERACEDRDAHLPFLPVDPRLAALRGDTRFQAFARRIDPAAR